MLPNEHDWTAARCRYARPGELVIGFGVYYKSGVLPIDHPAPMMWAPMMFECRELINMHRVWELREVLAPGRGECAFENAELLAREWARERGIRFCAVARYGATATVFEG